LKHLELSIQSMISNYLGLYH